MEQKEEDRCKQKQIRPANETKADIKSLLWADNFSWYQAEIMDIKLTIKIETFSVFCFKKPIQPSFSIASEPHEKLLLIFRKMLKSVVN